MATKILLKKSVTGGASPLTADLDQGELAINLVDRKIYTKDSGNNIKEISGAYVDGSAPANPVEGDLWYDTVNNSLKSHNGTAFVSAGYQNLSALEDVTITSIASGELLKWNGSGFVNNTLAEANIQPASTTVATVQAQDLNMGTNKILYSNVYANAAALPTASSYHGMFAHAHAEGKGYFAHAGSWKTLLDESSSDTDDLSEGSTNLYYTNARARAAISVTDAGGDGSLSISSGVITYTGPSASEVQAHITAGTGVAVSSGAVSIGQAVGTTSNVTFNKVTTSLIEGGSTITIDPAGLGDNTGTVVIAGDLTVNGTTTTVNSNEVNIGDAIILLNSDEAGTPSANAGIEIERGTLANKSLIWNETDDAWDLNNETLQNLILDGGTY